MKTYVYKLFLMGCLTVAFCCIAMAVQGQEITTFILVRHAEKVLDGSKDPSLTPQGNARARRLQAMLEKTDLAAIYTTPYKRTRATVAPVAQAKGLTIREYEPEKPAVIEEMLHTYAGKTILVSGHSNTIPEIVNWLTGSDKYTDFDDADYGNVMVVSVLAKGKATVTWLRY